jgi:predicted metalloprotease
VLFRNATNGGRCGMAQSAMGPFYCPPDRQIFLDTGFLPRGRDPVPRLLGQRLQVHAAYIIAHEAGHHIQNLLGILDKARQMQERAGSKAEANAIQVRVELQADCLSGVWVNREEKKRPGFLEAGDIDAALQTASAIGDDTLQRQATGRVVPDSFTHGSAAQRKRWFMTGYQQGSGAGLQHVRARCAALRYRFRHPKVRAPSRASKDDPFEARRKNRLRTSG